MSADVDREHSSGSTHRLGAAQVAGVVAGVAAIGFGVWNLVVTAPSATRPPVAVLWLAGGLVAHDAVLAPLAVVVGLVVVRLVGPPARRWVAVGLFVLASVLLVAAPGWLRP